MSVLSEMGGGKPGQVLSPALQRLSAGAGAGASFGGLFALHLNLAAWCSALLLFLFLSFGILLVVDGVLRLATVCAARFGSVAMRMRWNRSVQQDLLMLDFAGLAIAAGIVWFAASFAIAD